MKIQKILVPIDFSKCSKNALSYAMSLAQYYSAELVLANYYTIQIPVAEMTLDIQSTMNKNYVKNADDKFKILKTEMPELQDLKYDFISEMSFVAEGIYNSVVKHKIDLIIMGTKGASNRLNELFGSNTYNTIKKSEVPILAIPENASFEKFKKILFAADYKLINDTHSLDIIKELSKSFNAKIEILHLGGGWAELSTHQTEEAAALLDYFTNMEHSYHFVKPEGNIETGIKDHLEKNQNDLLVLIARKHYFPGTLFKKKVTKRTVMHTHLPLLTIPDSR